MADLRRCPFCGGVHVASFGNSNEIKITCHDCNASGPAVTPWRCNSYEEATAKAETLWNERWTLTKTTKDEDEHA